MRAYWIRLTADDFSTSFSDDWVTDVIDLYENDWYVNYSATKSRYGTNLMGNKIWTGLDADEDGEKSESGYKKNGRWVDTSGRVDIVSFDGPDNHGLGFFTSEDDNDDYFEDEWSRSDLKYTNQLLDEVDADRYVKFYTDSELDEDDEFLIRIEIDKPVMAPFYRMTKQVLDRFPEWMAMRELENEPDKETAVPESVGGQFINAVAGEWLDDLRRDIRYTEFQKFIDTVDTDQPAWAFESSIDGSEPIVTLEGDGDQLVRCADWHEFLESHSDEDVAWIDFDNDTLYTRKEYDNLVVGDTERVPQSPYHLWNFLDELGMLVDLERHTREDNETYRYRILDVFRNRGGGSYEGFKNAVRRELNLWKAHDIGPNEDHEDGDDGYPHYEDEGEGKIAAHPEVLEVEDILNDPSYFDERGLVRQRESGPSFIALMRRLARRFPATWGYFQWDNALWDAAGREWEGYGSAPYQFDGEEPDVIEDKRWLEYGVGDSSDLYVAAPTEYLGAQEFGVELLARGYEREYRTIYPPVEVELEVYGKGTLEQFDNPEQEQWFSIEIETDDGDYVHSFQVASKSDVSAVNDEATEASFDEFDFLSESKPWTREDLRFTSKDDGTEYKPEDEDVPQGVIPLKDVQNIKLVHGMYEQGEYQRRENNDYFDAWFSNGYDTILTYDSDPIEPDWNFDAEDESGYVPTVVFKSKRVNSLGDENWYTDPVSYRFRINDTSADDKQKSYSIDIEIKDADWDEGVENRELVLALQTQNPDNEYGASIINDDGSSTHLDKSYILVDGDNGWDPYGEMVISDGTSSVEFEVYAGDVDEDDYPIEIAEWNPTTWEGTETFSGTIDEHGPWRDGVPREGTRWKVLDDLTRDHFDIPHDDDHVVTRMNVKTTDDEHQGAHRVLSWLDSQFVESEADFRDNVSTPENAIKEYYDEDDGEYRFEPFVVHARLANVPREDWTPYIHAGSYFMGEPEYYLYADIQEEEHDTADIELEDVAHQGAPAIVKAGDKYLKEVAFFNDDLELTLTNEEEVYGTGEEKLYIAHEGAYDIEVNGGDFEVDTVESNEVHLDSVTDREQVYTVTYKVSGSFIVERFEYDEGNDRYFTKVTVDSEPSEFGVDNFEVYYEGSELNAYKPMDLALNPQKTFHHEGFIYLDYEEHPLEHLHVEISPSQIIADGEDNLLVTVLCLDDNGNPKPGVEVSLSTTFGSLSSESETSDDDGFVMVALDSDNETDTLHGELTVSADGVEAVESFEIEPDISVLPRIYVVPSTHYIRAEDGNKVRLYGKAMFREYEPITDAEVTWRKARHLRRLFDGNPDDYGTVTTDEEGAFEIGPFEVAEPDDPGYWFASVEVTADGETVGDITFWFEYAELTHGVERVTGMPNRGAQFRNPPGVLHPFANEAKFPYNYDEEEPERTERDIVVRWLPPNWFPLPKFRQYELGIISDDDTVDYTNYVNNVRPYVQDV